LPEPKKIEPTFFATPSEFRSWLEKHHDEVGELLVGFHKKGSGRPSITYAESVEEALCFGWIDGVRRSIDDTSYSMRFTPRRARSSWIAVNVARVKGLTRQGRMHPAGLRAFEARSENKTGIYAYEQRHMAKLGAEQERRFRANRKAWGYFSAQSPSYRQTAIWWVVSAKKEETRQRRLATLMEDSEHGRTVRPLTRPDSGS
jgi:uncharacterized protein YdeI (YjbR/CyaY-like superfamily)